MTSAPDEELPLEGVTVVSVEQAVAAPLATRHLADLGARVIKVERTGEGDFARDYDDAVHGLASHFVWLNRSKESVCVDLKSEGGRDTIQRLIATADVFVQNLGPGVADRLGFGAAELRAQHPKLVVVNLTGYGTGGPLRERKAYDMLVQAESGLASMTGTPETATKTGVPVSDIATALYAVTSVLSALFRSARTGKGAEIDVSMFDSTVEWLGHPMYTKMYTGRQLPRMGLSHASIAPYDAYPTRDGHILIGVQNDRGWRTLVTEVFGRADLAEHPKFATNILRVRNRSETDAAVAEESREYTTAELDEKLAAAGIPAAELNDMGALVQHPQLEQRDRWREVKTEAGAVRALLPPMTYSDIELRMGDVPALGEHTDRVLTELGVSGPEIQRLHAEGIIQ